ncbi:MAG: hypothetical protein QXK62_07005 [Thermoproteus sp.]
MRELRRRGRFVDGPALYSREAPFEGPALERARAFGVRPNILNPSYGQAAGALPARGGDLLEYSKLLGGLGLQRGP